MLKLAGIQDISRKAVTGVGIYSICLIVLLVACSATNPAKPNQTLVVTQTGAVIDYALPGNLKPAHTVGCVSIDKANNTSTPADIFPAIRTCINRGSYTNSVELFTMAGSYGQFDMARVLDRSAWNAMQVLQMQYMSDLTLAQKSSFNNAAESLLQDNSGICMQLEKLGPPNYVPNYMLEHGMAAFTGTIQNGGLVKDFNSQSEWKQILRDYVHCK